ncbi:MAG: Zn-ribbon domain-containing OB-fold protein [Candidatus Thorarchaeota archaeon]
MKSIKESLITRVKAPARIDNKLNAAKCNNCGNIRYPQRTYCNRCQGTDFSPILFGPEGEVITFTSTYKRKDSDEQRIFGSARLYSEDRKDSIGLSGIFDVKGIDDLSIGDKVVLVPNDKYNIFKKLED